MKDITQAVIEETTRDWLECFEESKWQGDLATSVFWRLALHVLPEGVDGDDERVRAALAEIKASVEAKGKEANHGA